MSTEENIVIRTEKLVKSFGENHVLKGFDLELNRGENLVVLGKSGSGKSVLIKCMVGLLYPDSGLVSVFGKEIPKLTQLELDELRTKIGFLFQSSALYDSMTVRENLEFPLRRHWMHKTKDEVNELVMEALKNVGLERAVDLMPSELSGGMRKRIGLARTLILKPEIMLYDEPTTGLHFEDIRILMELLNKLVDKGNTLIVIEHNLDVIKCADWVIDLGPDGGEDGGYIIAQGTPEEVAKVKKSYTGKYLKEEL